MRFLEPHAAWLEEQADARFWELERSACEPPERWWFSDDADDFQEDQNWLKRQQEAGL